MVRGAVPAGFDPTVVSREVLEVLRALPEYRDARCVLTYMPMAGEVDCEALLAEAGPFRSFVLPRVAGDELELRLYDPALMVGGYRGIREPSESAPAAGPDDIDLAIIPGVAFDRSLMRLGHGAGYYDRLLSRLHCPVIGLCFNYRLVDAIPAEPWDRPVDILITERECIRRRGTDIAQRPAAD